MHYLAILAKVGDKIINTLVGLLIILLLAYGSFSLWDSYQTVNKAYLSDNLKKFKPTEEESTVSLKDLMIINPDVLGWITVDDTNIDYPFVQGSDNLEYINKDVYGEFALSGAIFLDSRNNSDFSDSYNLFYGHHMDYGAMFGDISLFTDQTYFDSHTTGTLYLKDATFPIAFFASVKISATDEWIFGAGNLDETARKQYIDYVYKNASCARDIGVTEQDKLICLSTCSDEDTNGRIALVGKILQ